MPLPNQWVRNKPHTLLELHHLLSKPSMQILSPPISTSNIRKMPIVRFEIFKQQIYWQRGG